MAFSNTKKTLRSVQDELNEFRKAHRAADARLDGYGPTLAAQHDGTVTSHVSGRFESTTVVDDTWQVNVKNEPGGARAVFTALVHDVAPLPVKFAPGLGADFSPWDLEAIEDWITEARTGKAVDHARHANRAAELARLAG